MGNTVYDRHASANLWAVTSLTHQRAITERLLLTALREHDVSTQAVEAGRRASFLASASRDLAASLDDGQTREAVRRRTLLREGSWCIVDIIELGGAVQRLAVAHPDSAKQALAQRFADHWFPVAPPHGAEPAVVTGTHANAEQLAALHELGFGGLLVVPLVVRETMLGAITFVTDTGAPSFSPEEHRLALDIADLCALALDNARLYREANMLREVADAANRAKSTFLGNMSHELMTPLNAIGGYITLLEMGLRGPVSTEQHVDLERIRHNQTHLLALISEILTFVRSDSGGLKYELTRVSAQAAMRDVSDMLQGAVDERQLTLVLLAADADATMWADADRVRQILLNLVMNAVKYATVAGGTITLSGTVTPHRVAIHVTDNGPGIPEAQLGAIFDPFVQLKSGLADRRGGVGLGLAISRDLARAMNGDLTVNSTVGTGSRFTLELPRAPQAPKESV
jgi:signal transduction histidine kinase